MPRKIKLKRREAEWIEHPWAEEENGILISNYECAHCHSWEKYFSIYCPHCGYKMKRIVKRNKTC